MDAENEDLATVEELEASLTSEPTNLETRAELIGALFDDFLYSAAPESDLDRIKQLLAEVADDELLYERAYLELLEGDDQGIMVQKLREAAVAESQASTDPLSSDELWDWIEPLSGIAPEGAYEAIAEGFAAGWPDSPVVMTLKGLTAPDDVSAINLFLKALQADEEYWYAAQGCAAAYANQKNWTKALEYGKRALASELAAEIPILWFDRAICEGKLKLYAEEAKSYRKCLELDPDYPFAKNNLGWALMKAGRTEEAVPLLRDAMEQGNDGKYPLRNLAEALQRLGRYSDAIDVLQRDVYRGRLTSYATKQIAKLQTLLPSS